MPKAVSKELKQTIGDAIADLLEEQSIKNKELAKQAGVTPEAISRIINGVAAPGHETLIKIADFFNVSTDHLYGRKVRK